MVTRNLVRLYFKPSFPIHSMISIVKAGSRYHLQEGWLSTYHHFSFDTYHDPKNMGWGALRVFNDDHIAPGGKFGMHPHANFEIISIVLDGAIEHMDSEGHRGITKKNEVQAMTAGRGVFHSEENPERGELHLLQIWMAPSEKSLPPSYSQASFSEKDFTGKLLPLVSGKAKAPLAICANAAIYRCKLKKAQKITFAPSGEYAFAYCVSGEFSINGKGLSSADSAKMRDEKKLEFSSASGADFVLIELP